MSSEVRTNISETIESGGLETRRNLETLLLLALLQPLIQREEVTFA